MMIRFSFVACICSLVLAAAPASAQPQGSALGSADGGLHGPAGIGQDDWPIPAELSAAGRALVTASNAFALDIYKADVEGDSNLFFSPASISTAMGLAYRGAAGSTADEIRRIMHYPFEPRAFVAPEGEMLRTMQFQVAGRELHLANSLWIELKTKLLPDYLADLEACCRAGLQRVDFRGNRESARLRINRWVEEQTANRIRDLLAPDDVQEGTRAILVNTLYLKAAWAEPFDPRNTTQGPFTLLNGGRVDSPLMQRRGTYSVVSRGGVQGIALPYRGGELEMVVLLPDSATAFARLEQGLSARKLASWAKDVDEAPGRETILTFPRFRMESRVDLVPVLKRLGMETALSDDADFSLMSPFDRSSSDPEQWGFKVKKVIHQTFLEVDEKGSEAAAATAVVDVMVSGSRIPPPPPLIFRADHPFLFSFAISEPMPFSSWAA
jgi:serpin B